MNPLIPLCLAASLFTQQPKSYTPDQLIVLNGIGGFGDVGAIDASTDRVAPTNRIGFSLRFTWEDHPADPPWWSIRQGLPLGAKVDAYDTFSCDLFVQSNDGAALKIYLLQPDDNRWVCFDKALKDVKSGEWVHIQVPRSSMTQWKLSTNPHNWSRLSGVGIEPYGGKAVFNLDNMRLTGPSCKPLDIISVEDDGYHANPRWNIAVGKAPAIGDVLYPFDGARMSDLTLRKSPSGFHKIVGAVGTPLSGFGDSLVDTVAGLRSQSIPTVYYSTFGAGYTRYLTRRGAWDENAVGHSLNKTPGNLFGWDYQHTYAMAHPAVTQAQRDRIDALLKAGIGTWMVVDYTFPWVEATWGYSETMQAAYRADLQGKDEGLYVRENGKQQVIHFADYFKAYNGFAPRPADAGYRSWAEFKAPREEPDAFKAARGELFMYLRSYEWLKLPDRTGRYYASKGGNPLWMIPNPEDTYGSSDYVFMLRSAGVGNLFPEWFGCIGYAAEAGYASLPYLREQADKSGARLSNIQETGAGGHSAAYLDWRLYYGGIYALTAAGRMDNLDNDFMDEAYFDDMADSKRNPYQFTRFRDGVTKGLAFHQARAEKPMRPASPILCVSERPPAHACGSFFFNLDQAHTLGLALSRAHYAFDVRDSLDLDRVVNRYNLIAYSPWSPRVGDLAVIQQWLNAKPGRTLITHSFVPTRDTRLYRGLNGGTELGGVDGGAKLGLGHIRATEARKCVITKAVGAWARAFTVGETIEFPSPITACDRGDTLVMTDAGPLVTRAHVGKSTVLYLHYTPNDSDAVRQLDARVMAVAAAQAGVKPVCQADYDAPTQIFEVKGGYTVLTWDAPSMAKWTFRYVPGIEAMSYEAPGVAHTVKLPAPGSAPWVTYDFWADREQRVVPSQEVVCLQLRDALAGFYYAGPDTPTFRATLKAAHAVRSKMRSLQFDAVK